MRNKGFILAGSLVLICAAGYADTSLEAEESKLRVAGISPEVVADYIHAVIEADRTLYATHVVERMHDSSIVAS